MHTIVSIKEKLAPHFEKEPILRAIVFGSYAKGTADLQSDLDMVIDSDGELLGLDFYRILDIITETLGISIDLIELAEIEKGSALDMTLQSEGLVIYDRKVA